MSSTGYVWAPHHLFTFNEYPAADEECIVAWHGITLLANSLLHGLLFW